MELTVACKLEFLVYTVLNWAEECYAAALVVVHYLSTFLGGDVQGVAAAGSSCRVQTLQLELRSII